MNVDQLVHLSLRLFVSAGDDEVKKTMNQKDTTMLKVKGELGGKKITT